MSRLRLLAGILTAIWRFLDRIGWVIAIVLIGIGVHAVHNQGNQIAGQTRQLRHQARQLRAQVDANAALQSAQTHSAVEARRANCESSNALRAGLRLNVEEGQRSVPLLLRLLPQLNTPEVLAINKSSVAFQLHAFGPLNCKAYVEEILPERGAPTVRDLRRAGF